MHARTHARNVDARTLSSVWPWPMRRSGAEPQSHTLCTAAAQQPSLQSSAGLQLEKVAVNCNAAEKALLAEVAEAHPDASYIDMLRLFKARRSVADGHSWRACCICVCFAVPAQICSQLPRLTLCSVLRCLFFVVVCLFVCLFVCLCV